LRSRLGQVQSVMHRSASISVHWRVAISLSITAIG
jgi:hypothetical protein